jgi:hypothetical protein
MPLPYIADQIDLKDDMMVVQVFERLSAEQSKIVLTDQARRDVNKGRFLAAKVLNRGPGIFHPSIGRRDPVPYKVGSWVVMDANVYYLSLWQDHPTGRYMVRSGEVYGKIPEHLVKELDLENAKVV